MSALDARLSPGRLESRHDNGEVLNLVAALFIRYHRVEQAAFTVGPASTNELAGSAKVRPRSLPPACKLVSADLTLRCGCPDDLRMGDGQRRRQTPDRDM